MKKGGFAAIIGNPPYLELREIDYIPKGFITLESKAVHSMCVERSVNILNEHGAISMIVPLALPSTQRMVSTQSLLERGRSLWITNYAWRPGKLFDAVNRALTIFVSSYTKNEPQVTWTTSYQKWGAESRDGLFERVPFARSPRGRSSFWIPKVSWKLEESILSKLLQTDARIHSLITRRGHPLYYRTTGGLYWKVFTDFAPKFRLNGKSGSSSRETNFSLEKKAHVKPTVAALSSDVFWWWYTITSNLRDLNPTDISEFPIPLAAIEDGRLSRLGEQYLDEIDANSSMLVREQRSTGTTETQSFKIQLSKPILDEIDCVLARHYGFTEEELDFIVNYDIKYRLGADAGGEED